MSEVKLTPIDAEATTEEWYRLESRNIYAASWSPSTDRLNNLEQALETMVLCKKWSGRSGAVMWRIVHKRIVATPMEKESAE
jgi:hypothetical protein